MKQFHTGLYRMLCTISGRTVLKLDRNEKTHYTWKQTFKAQEKNVPYKMICAYFR